MKWLALGEANTFLAELKELEIVGDWTLVVYALTKSSFV